MSQVGLQGQAQFCQNQKVKQVLAFIPYALFKYHCIYAGLYQTFVGLNSVFLWSVTYFVDGPI